MLSPGLRRLACTGVVLGCVLCAARASAGPSDYLGYDVETGSLAGSTVAYGASIGVVHTNPALLPEIDQQVYAGLTLTAPRLHTRLMDKPRGTDVPISIYDSDVGTTSSIRDRALPTIELSSRRRDLAVNGLNTQVGVGFVSGFGLDRFRLAVLAQAPLTGGGASSIQTHYDDEREAAFTNQVHFTRFGEWDRIFAFVAGAGYALTPRLSVGVAGELAAAATARLQAYIPDATVESYAQSNLGAQVNLRLRPVLGVRWRATDWLALGLVWRDESSFHVDGQSEVTLWNSHEASTDKTIPKHSTLSFPIVFGWVPMEVALGAGVDRGPLTVQAAATWQRWSTFRDHHDQSPDTAAMLASPPTSFDPSAYAFSDTIAISGGATIRLGRAWAASLGGAWYPSPVPPQTGRTNQADADLFAITTGLRHDFEIAGKRFTAAAGLQLWIMEERTTYKDPTRINDEFPDSARTLQGGHAMPEAQGLQTNNPGFPGYTAGGWLAAGGLSLSHRF